MDPGAWIAIISIGLGMIGSVVALAYKGGQLATQIGHLAGSIEDLTEELHTVRDTQNDQGRQLAGIEARLGNGSRSRGKGPN